MRLGLIAPSAAVALGILGHAPAALACGGIFSPPSQPIDQTAERILFQVRPDGSVLATVEILYSGDAESFSWIIPVEGEPSEMGVADPNILRLLDQATLPTSVPPTFKQCQGSYGGGGGGFFGGCGPVSRASSAPDAVNAGGVDVELGFNEPPPPVNVNELPPVGPYDGIVVVDSSDPAALITWLNEHGYAVTDAMRPVIEAYSLEGKKFLAIKLAAEAGTSDIVPVSFLCENAFPTLPARITSVAASPEMSFLVFVAAETRYEPMNYNSVEVPGIDINPYVFNYYAQVSRRVDEAGGRAFITERAQPSSLIKAVADATTVLNNRVQVNGATPGLDETKVALNAVFSSHSYITRMYTRINPEEMTDDPMFVPADKPDFDGVIDQSGRLLDTCGGTQTGPQPCVSTYCGDDSVCASTNEGDGCVCGAGMVARQIPNPNASPTGFNGQPLATVFCQENRNMRDLDALDACAGVSCGEGTCHSVGGAPTCECNDGFAAIADQGGGRGVRCVAAIEIYETTQLDPPADTLPQPPLETAPAPPEAGGCASSSAAGASVTMIGLMFGSVAILARVLRRRRR